MKKITVILIMMFLATSYLFAQEESNAEPVSWNEQMHDFGKIELKVPATATFSFKNSGEMPVVITNVRSSCGCTVAKYTKEPVKPGEEGEVSATYNAARVGPFMKSVTVTMEGMQPIILKIKGDVVDMSAEAEKTEQQ